MNPFLKIYRHPRMIDVDMAILGQIQTYGSTIQFKCLFVHRKHKAIIGREDLITMPKANFKDWSDVTKLYK